jgi:ATP/maltotriose-dependent transcriptional regulator MalT
MGTRIEVGKRERDEGAPRVHTPSVKLVPPKLPGRFLRREPLEQRLDAAASHRLTAVVAAAGFGKSTQLAARALANGWSWYTIDGADAVPSVLAQGLGDALRRRFAGLEDAVATAGTSGGEQAVADHFAASLAHALEGRLSDDFILVVDDVHELGRDAAAARVLEGLVRYAPPEFHLVLSSRDEMPFSIARLRAQGNVLDFDGSDFAFSSKDVETAVATEFGRDRVELASPLHEITAGWPVAVQFAIEMLASVADVDRAGALDALAARRGPLFMYLAEEIFVREPAEVQDLLRVVAHFERITPALCHALALSDADEILEDLARRGLLAVAEGTYTPHALIRQFALTTWSVPPGEIRELHRKAGKWFAAHDDAVAATKAFTAAGDRQALARLLDASWLQLDNAAAVETILEAATLFPRSESGAWALLVAHALIIRGDVEEARGWLSGIESEGAARAAFLDALAHMHRHEHREALQKFMVARDAEVDSHCSSFIADQLICLGRPDEARPFLQEAIATAQEDDNPAGAIAEARLAASDLAYADGDLPAALALAQEGAARYAELENVLGECSAQNRFTKLLALLGRYDEALEASVLGARLSDRIGFSMFQPWTSRTRALVWFLTGRLDEAADEFGISVAACERLGSHEAAHSLIGLGDVHRARGEVAQARSAYERALPVAERSGSVSAEALASAGLARVIVEDDPTQAAILAERALQLSPGMPERTEALLAKGWIAVRTQDIQCAAEAATEALAKARQSASPGLLAEALELATFAAHDPTDHVELLQEALGIRLRLGNPLAEAEAVIALASLVPGGSAANEQARAEQTLRELGIQQNRAAAGLASMARAPVAAPLAIETLGRFAVLRDGAAVTHAEWQSKKARDLLKILVTRRGQATPRDYLIELLWPDEDPSRTSKRLAVAVNVLRNVLDPGRRHENDHFVVGGVEGLRLDIERLSVDVEMFLRLSDDALTSNRQQLDGATHQLEAADSAYAGEFLPEDRYEDWAAPLRDEVRATYLEVVRLLATKAGDHSAAVRYLLRILALDPFDEEAHLGLIAAFAEAGMHGEARRAYRRYVERMSDIGLEPAAYEQAAATH